MNKLTKTFLLALFTIWTAHGLTAQETEPNLKLPKSIIKFVPFELASNTFMLEWEGFNKTVDKSFSVGMGLTSGNQYDGEQFGVKGEIMYRVYLKGLSPYIPKRDREDYLRGVYAGFFTRGGYVENANKFYHYSNNNNTGTYLTNRREGTWFFPGVMIGATRTFWDVLFIELHVGAGVKFSDLSNSNPLYLEEYPYYGVNDIGYNGVAPNIGFKIGLGL